MTREASVRSAKRIDRFPPLFLEIPLALTLLSREILFFHKNKWIKQRVKTNIARKENTKPRKISALWCWDWDSANHISRASATCLLVRSRPRKPQREAGQWEARGMCSGRSGPPVAAERRRWCGLPWSDCGCWLPSPRMLPKVCRVLRGLCLNHARHLPGRLWEHRLWQFAASVLGEAAAACS